MKGREAIKILISPPLPPDFLACNLSILKKMFSSFRSAVVFMRLCIFAYVRIKNAYWTRHVRLSVRMSILANHWTLLKQIRKDVSLWPWYLAVLVLSQNNLSPSYCKYHIFIVPGTRVWFLPSLSYFFEQQLIYYALKCAFRFLSRKHRAEDHKLSFAGVLQATELKFCCTFLHTDEWRRHYGPVMSVRPSVLMSALFDHWIDLDKI